MDFARITIKDNRNQNSSKNKGKRRDLGFREVFMQELQLDKVLRQTFSICKGWSLWSNSKLSELDSRRECLQTMAKSTCHMTVCKWKSFVYKCLPVNKSQDEIIEIDSWLKYALKTQTKLKRHV